MRATTITALLAVAGTFATANAYEFRCRWVERIGNQDVELQNSAIETQAGVPRLLRLQVGVFDGIGQPVPVGGLMGWNVGRINRSGNPGLADLRRTPGRLAPFTFANQATANGNPPLPGGDPFQEITQIDATVASQTLAWRCNPDGSIPPPPPAVTRGINTFVSIYAIELTGIVGSDFQIIAAGNLTAISRWNMFGTPNPPDCGDPSDQSDDIAGTVMYIPEPLTGSPFSCVLNVHNVPGAGAGIAMSLGIGGLAVWRRRR